MRRGNIGQHREDWYRLEKIWILFLISLTDLKIFSKSFHLSVPQFHRTLTCLFSQGPVRIK